MRQMTAEQFLRDAGEHQMTVHRDDGTYRHLSFRRPGPDSWNMWFEIVTWPGSLIIHGDMGTWAFSRVDDMFRFFRNSRELAISAPYWTEKCESADARTGPCKRFDADYFKGNVLDSLDGYDLEPEKKADIIKELDGDIPWGDSEDEIRAALNRYRHYNFKFSDLWEIEGRTYSFHLLWCLYAIVWGIQQYDAAEQPTENLEAQEATR